MGVVLFASSWLMAPEAQQKVKMRLMKRVNKRIPVCLLVRFYVVFLKITFLQNDSESNL
jgi:hypothetical protein